MGRDELILSFKPILEKLVYKYNNHKMDEDLLMICYIKTIEAVDRCISENINRRQDIQNRVIRWCTNAIIDELRIRNRVSQTDLVDNFDEVISDDYGLELVELKSMLTKKQKQILELRLEGYNEEEIKDKLGIKNSVYHSHMKNIKKFLN